MHNVTYRNFAPEDIDWLIAEHEALYVREMGFDPAFAQFVRDILEEFFANLDPARERSWLAVRDGERLGAIFCTDEGDDIAKLRVLLVVPEARGLGLGRELVKRCQNHALKVGFRKLQLWTFKSLKAAGALYAASGFELLSERRSFSFGADRDEQIWEIDLTTPLSNLAIVSDGR